MNLVTDPLEQQHVHDRAFGELGAIIGAATCASLLRCTKAQVEILADREQLPATKYGRSWIFVTAQILQHVALRCAQNVIPTTEAYARRKPLVSDHSIINRSEKDATPKQLPIAALRPRRPPGRPRQPISSVR